MTEKIQTEETQKCYNSFSCIAAVLIILFVIGSIIWDVCVTKPSIHKSIEEIQTEIKEIHSKIDAKATSDSLSTAEFFNTLEAEDSIVLADIK